MLARSVADKRTKKGEQGRKGIKDTRPKRNERHAARTRVAPVKNDQDAQSRAVRATVWHVREGEGMGARPSHVRESRKVQWEYRGRDGKDELEDWDGATG